MLKMTLLKDFKKMPKKKQKRSNLPLVKADRAKKDSEETVIDALYEDVDPDENLSSRGRKLPLISGEKTEI